MSEGPWIRLDAAARGLSPFALSLLVVLAAVIPLHIRDISSIIPAMSLIAVYFWIVHRPDLMPAWAVFLIGLVQDLISGAALGVGPFVLLIVYATVTSQHRIFASGGFFLLWALFVPLAGVVFFLSWLFNCLIMEQFIGPQPVLFQYLTTIAFYPCLNWLFAQAQRAFLQ